MHVHNSSAPGDTQREIVDWSARRRELSPGQSRRRPSASRDWSPETMSGSPARGHLPRRVPARSTAGRQDVLGRHYSPPACRKVFEDVHPAPGPPVTSLEASRAILARSGQGSAAGASLTVCKPLQLIAFVAEGRGDRGGWFLNHCPIAAGPTALPAPALPRYDPGMIGNVIAKSLAVLTGFAAMAMSGICVQDAIRSGETGFAYLALIFAALAAITQIMIWQLFRGRNPISLAA